jgi:pyruvate,water dikinase
VLPAAVAEEVAAITARIATSFGYPVDLEWVWDGTDVWWVQLRPITGLADVNVYSSRISREVMPGIIKPLVWSVNVPMVNRAWIDLFTEFIGANELEPGDLAKSFAYRSYFNMSAIGDVFELLGMPRDSLELLLGLPAGSEQPSFAPSAKTMRLLPRLLVAAVRKAAFGRKVPAEVATLQARFGRYDRGELTEMTDEALLLAVDELIETGTRAAYANIVTPLLANLYHGLLRRNLGKSGLDAERVDVGAHSHAQLDPNRGLDRLAAGVAALPDVERRRIEEHGRDALPADLDAEFADFLDAFGHLSDSGNDFSVPPWRENPDHVLDLVLQHVATIGTATRVPWEDAIATVGVLRRPLTGFLRSRTVAFMGHRDAVSSMYTYGYGLLRRYFLEAGRRLVSRGLLEDPDDVMYLTHAEVRAGLTGLGAPPDLRTISAHHRAEIAAVADLVMPDVIYGDDFVASPPAEAADRLVGIPSSRGRHRGVLRIVRGIEDFGRVLPGDVIAIPFSDVGWTPLFARAGAVIAEAGGMLSHSSIVAREYQIPCIVSVAGATTLPDGVEVFVDGYSGEVIVERGQS